MSRVVQVIPHRRVGGMQRVAELLDAGLPAKRVQSSVVDLAAERRTAAVPGVWLRLVRRWRAERPDAVIGHSPLAAAFCLTAARVAGVRRRVIVVHAARHGLGRGKTRLVAALAASRTATEVVVCGRSALDSFHGSLTPLARPAIAIPNGVPAPRAGGGEHGERRVGRPLRCLLAGRLVPEKRADVAIRAVAGVDAELTIVGDGPKRPDLERLAADTGAHVRFAGALPGDAMPEQYRQHDVLLFPSEAEGLPLVLLEATAEGLAVIAGAQPFNDEVLGDAYLRVSGDDAEVWRSAVAALAADEPRRAALAEAGRERVPLFALDAMVASYAALLDRR